MLNVVQMAMHSAILTQSQIQSMVSGEAPSTDIIAFWTFDDLDNPLSYDIGSTFAPVMSTSENWEGNTIVPSEAPFSRTNAPLSSYHLVIYNTYTLLDLLPSWGSNSDTINLISATGEISIFAVDKDSCLYTPLSVPNFPVCLIWLSF